VNPKELTDEELDKALKLAPAWSLVNSPVPGAEPKKRVELMRTYEFHSFEDAMHFMGEATAYISRMNHHPRWQNVWRSLTIWLSTWDIGHRPSRLDVELAGYLDSLFRNYASPVVKDVDAHGRTTWRSESPTDKPNKPLNSDAT
jgi:pterin-4a-carbinolamine dehydratase